jgi:hypothetical protein
VEEVPHQFVRRREDLLSSDACDRCNVQVRGLSSDGTVQAAGSAKALRLTGQRLVPGNPFRYHSELRSGPAVDMYSEYMCRYKVLCSAIAVLERRDKKRSKRIVGDLVVSLTALFSLRVSIRRSRC